MSNSFRGLFCAPGFALLTAVGPYSGSNQVDAYVPVLTNRRVIVFLHGGGWDAGSRLDEYYANICELLALQGFCVFNADYTLTGGAYTQPITDTLALMSWVRTNAATFNGDPTRVALLGASAGGHLAFMAAIQGTIGTTRPDAAIGWSPATDLEVAYAQGNGPGTLDSYMGFVLAGHETAYRNNSPKVIVTSNCCPLRIVGSDTEDSSASGPGLDVVQYNSMETAALAVGVSVTKRIFSGSVHAIFSNHLAGFLGSSDVAETATWIRSTLP